MKLFQREKLLIYENTQHKKQNFLTNIALIKKKYCCYIFKENLLILTRIRFPLHANFSQLKKKEHLTAG